MFELCHLVAILTRQIILMCVLATVSEERSYVIDISGLSASDWKCIVISSGQCNRSGAISSVIRSVFGPYHIQELWNKYCSCGIVLRLNG